MRHIVALSGGKDSTALALALREKNPHIEYEYICTPTGDELPSMIKHWEKIEEILGKKLIRITNKTLYEWIDYYDALPNWRQRWCTRLLKIEPCLAYIKSLQSKPILYVGLRADEEERKGIYSENVITKFPLREWGWGLEEVVSYLREKEVSIPARTDCSLCFYQKVSEWYYLWRDNREYFNRGIEFEKRTGYTFRNPNSKKWGASLDEMGQKFEQGYLPFGATNQLDLFENEEITSCRVCRL